MEKPQIGRSHREIALSEAQEINPDAAIGETMGIVTREGGSTKFLLGTDHLERDLLNRIMHGARISLIVAGIMLGVGGTIGVALGLMSGWYGGWVDEFLMRLSFPCPQSWWRLFWWCPWASSWPYWRYGSSPALPGWCGEKCSN